METIKTNFNELVSLAKKMETDGEMVDAAKVRLWLMVNGYKGDIRVRPEAVESLWIGDRNIDILQKAVILIEENIRHNIGDISDVYPETCLMEETSDIPDWKMTVCLNGGRAYCTEEYTARDGRRTNVTVVAPCGMAWFDSQTLMDIFAYTPHTYNITADALIGKADCFLPHEDLVKSWLDAFGFDKGHNVVVKLDSPADYNAVLDGVYKDIFGTWLCKAGDCQTVLKVSKEAPNSIIRGYDTDNMQINEVRYTQLRQILPHSLRDAESVLVRVWEKDKTAPSVTLQYILWKGHLFDYDKSKELVKKWTTE